jgi:hypothetical protein
MASSHGAIPKRKLSRYGLKRIGVNTVYRPKSFDSGLTLVQEFQKGDSMPYLCTYDNRRIGEHDLATLSKYLTMQANLACDLAMAGSSRASVMAEAAAHWAFCLQPDLRAEDDTFWADTYPLTCQN